MAQQSDTEELDWESEDDEMEWEANQEDGTDLEMEAAVLEADEVEAPPSAVLPAISSAKRPGQAQRRIEMFRESRWLQEALSDFDDYVI